MELLLTLFSSCAFRAPGVQFARVLPFTPVMDVVRTDLLRLMLVCLSKPLYISPGMDVPLPLCLQPTSLIFTLPFSPPSTPFPQTPDPPPLAYRTIAKLQHLQLCYPYQPYHLYQTGVSRSAEVRPRENAWLAYVCSGQHPKSLPWIQSLLNVFVGFVLRVTPASSSCFHFPSIARDWCDRYDPIGFGIPYGQLWVPDYEHEALLEVCY